MTSWKELRDEAAGCTRCDLYRRATQTVFGEGRTGVSIALVGEQPGDQEDKQGHPFVGPAGRILDRALVEAGIDRDDVYVTNAVKHFKWTERGKRRIHQRPNGTEIRACGFWLEAELGATGRAGGACWARWRARPIVRLALPGRASTRARRRRIAGWWKKLVNGEIGGGGGHVRLALQARRAGRAGRGGLARFLEGLVVGTIHPSAVLRGPDSEGRDRAYE